jgi:hypothetical protein
LVVPTAASITSFDTALPVFKKACVHLNKGLVRGVSI